MSEITRWTLGETAEALSRRDVSSVEVTQSYLDRITATDPRVHAFLSVTSELALKQASEADARRAQGENGKLLGVPLGIKDIILARGTRTTAASRILENFVAPYDSTVCDRLRKAGAVFVGKLNCDEFAMGSSTENSAYGPTFNPWDLTRSPGGSSGGSAAAVAAHQCVASLGTDTGGSIRQPAAFCGIVGLKPTYGRVSRYGVIAFASSLDQVGPMGRSVADCADLLSVIAGHDPHDSTSSSRPLPEFLPTNSNVTKLDGLRIGIPREYFVTGLNAEIEASVRRALSALEAMGAKLVEISLPHTEYAVPTYYIVATAEASSNLARYDGVRFGHRRDHGDGLRAMYARTRDEGFGAEVKRRIMLGTYALSAGYYDAYYMKALQVRTLIRQDFEKAFENVDVIATPTTPNSAFGIGEKSQDPLSMYLEDIFTIAVNLAGLPALSMPCGKDGRGLPIGLQLIGRAFDEAGILRVGAAFESTGDWPHQRPAAVE